MRGANLKGANLDQARVFAGNLSSFLRSKDSRCVDAAQQSENVENCQTNLQGAYLRFARLEGADLQGANIGSADVSDADLTWSDLRGLSQSPLDKETYGELEKIRTDTIRDKSVRELSLNWLQSTVGQLTNLSAARSDERSVLCNNVELFRFCVTQAQSAEYADHRALFLGTLGCDGKDAAIARGITLWHQFYLQTPKQQKDPILMAFIKHVTAIPEKDCPGWAALPADQRDTLRTLAGRKTSAR